MALTFPLTTAQFMDLLPVGQITFDAPENVEIGLTGGGDQLTAQLAPQLWTGEIKLGVMTRDETARFETLIDLLRPAGRSFLAYDTRRPRPVYDPTGAILGASTPLLDTLNVNNRDIRISGLPAAYVLTQGDYIGFSYGSGRRALHRVVTTVTASGAGLTPLFEVTPIIRAGAVVSTAVTLIKPVIKAVIEPGSIARGTTSAWVTTGAGFRFVQSLTV